MTSLLKTFGNLDLFAAKIFLCLFVKRPHLNRVIRTGSIPPLMDFTVYHPNVQELMSVTRKVPFKGQAVRMCNIYKKRKSVCPHRLVKARTFAKISWYGLYAIRVSYELTFPLAQSFGHFCFVRKKCSIALKIKVG